MTSSIFCIMIPLMYFTPKGTWYQYEEKYECFRSEEICAKRLSENIVYLNKLQNDRVRQKPYCKAEGRNSVDDNLSPTGSNLSPVEKAWYKFW